MSLACDSTGPSPGLRPPGSSPIHWRWLQGGPASLVAGVTTLLLQAGSCVSFSYTLMGYFFLLPFPLQPGIHILGVRGGAGGRAGDRSRHCPGAGIGRQHPQDSFSTKRCTGNPAQPMIRGKWSHFLTSCLIRAEEAPVSSRVLCWPPLSGRLLASPFSPRHLGGRRVATSWALGGAPLSAVCASPSSFPFLPTCPRLAGARRYTLRCRSHRQP